MTERIDFMEIMNSIVEFFGLSAEITTFTDLLHWFVLVMCAVIIVTTVLKLFFKATYKIDRGLR